MAGGHVYEEITGHVVRKRCRLQALPSELGIFSTIFQQGLSLANTVSKSMSERMRSDDVGSTLRGAMNIHQRWVHVRSRSRK